MGREVVVHICGTMEYYSAIRNTFESVLMRWMNLEPITQMKQVRKRKKSIVF